ncbi:MAG: alpha/beta fold hydrolase [Chloroflexi bacterium]|nr:alpha/beta fold hydrolase [Chloroflexota bacterium]
MSCSSARLTPLIRLTFLAALSALLAFGFAPVGALAQEGDGMFHDPTGRFSFPLPDNWTNADEEGLPHYVSPEGADLFVATLESDTSTLEAVAAGVDAVAKSAGLGITDDPVQSSPVPVPGGVTWVQNIYLLDGGATIVAVIGRGEAGTVYTLILRGSQAALAAATPALNAAILGFALAGEISLGSALPEYADEAAYTETEITLRSGDLELPATLTMPAGAENVPAVVLVHGSGPNDRDETLGVLKPFRNLAVGLASRGIAVLRYDKRTYAYRGQPEMLGETVTIDSETTDDAVAAIAQLAEIPGIDPSRVYVLGHSLGGMMAARIAARSGLTVGVIVMAGPARPYGEMLASQVDYLDGLLAADASAPEGTTNAEVLGPVIVGLAKLAAGIAPEEAFPDNPVGAAYWASIVAVDQMADAQALDLPFLVLQGERDYQVTMDDFVLWQDALAGNARATFISYPDVNHIFMALGDLSRKAIPADYNAVGFVAQAVIEDIAGWILGQE